MITMASLLADCSRLDAQNQDIPEEYLDALNILADRRIHEASERLNALNLNPYYDTPEYSPRHVIALYAKLEADRISDDFQLRTPQPFEPEEVEQSPSPDSTSEGTMSVSSSSQEPVIEEVSLEELLATEPDVSIQAQLVQEAAQNVLQTTNPAQGCACCREFWDPTYVKPPQTYESASFIFTNLPVRTWTNASYIEPQAPEEPPYMSMTNIPARSW